jgi:asparagine synthase (glutamine-hydrolysing)
MSAILGVFGDGPRSERELAAQLARMAGRGADRTGTWQEGGAVLAVSRFEWEAGGAFSGEPCVLAEDDLVVAADASLYYRADLLDRLAAMGVRPTGSTPSHLVLAAYRAWGSELIRHLEGDYAFVVFDRLRRSVLCARDFTGRRPLYYADAGGTLVVASTIAGVLAHPAVPSELNLTAIAETAAGLFAASHETVYEAIRGVPAGHVLVHEAGRTSVRRFWLPPPVAALGSGTMDDAASELRELLVAATAERLDDASATSVWLSGGWDSPAVFAAAGEWHRRTGVGTGIRPVSMSYPPGDRGREDELIESVLQWWDTSTHWIDSSRVPFLLRPAEAAAERDEPFAHAFEHWTRALARGSRSVGAHVALDGTGGDQFFAASLLYLADLLHEGRWITLRREWQARVPDGGGRQAFELLLLPLLPEWARALGRRVRPHRSWSGAFEAHVPDWIDEGFARRHGLVGRAHRSMLQPTARRLADAELQYYLTHPTGARLVSAYSANALAEGVEVRSPFHDERVIEFALRRPLHERASGRETKRLLRRACEGWLPPQFLAPRAHRTGGTGTYAHRALRQSHARMIGEMLAEPVLAKLGIVRAEVLQRRWAEFMHGISRYELPLYLTFQTELWLRARLGAGVADSMAMPARVVA